MEIIRKRNVSPWLVDFDSLATEFHFGCWYVYVANFTLRYSWAPADRKCTIAREKSLKVRCLWRLMIQKKSGQVLCE